MGNATLCHGVAKEGRMLYMELQFALIASNFTDTLDFIRWQVESLERWEIVAVVLTLLCMILSSCLHFLGSCMRRNVSKQDMSGQAICKTMDGELEIHSVQSIFNSSSLLFCILPVG